MKSKMTTFYIVTVEHPDNHSITHILNNPNKVAELLSGIRYDLVTKVLVEVKTGIYYDPKLQGEI